MNKTSLVKRVLCALIATMMVWGLVPPLTVGAATTHNINAGNVIISTNGDHIINGSGTSTTNTITVNNGVTSNITLNNVNIDVRNTVNTAAFNMAGATVNLMLAGTNNLRSGANRAGIHAPHGSVLTIEGTGELTAHGGTLEAGIGGEQETTFTSHTVTFNNNFSGAPPNATRQTGPDGKLSEMPPPPARTGFIFNGWWSATSGGTRMQLNRVYTANTTVHARWIAIAEGSGRFILTFDGNGGTVMQTTAQTETNGRLAPDNFPTVPLRPGHVFVGWYRTTTTTRREDMLRENVTHTANTTYFARWQAVRVRFNLDGGTLPSGNTTNPRNVNASGQVPNLPTPTRSGHTFAGWFTSQTGGTQVNANTVLNASSTIFARWTPNSGTTYTITLNVNGGTAISPNTRTTGTDRRLTAANLPTPTRSGHTFLGWFDRGSGRQVTTNTVFTANTEIHARWMINEPNLSGSRVITLDPNGGTLTETTRRTDSHGFLMLPLPTPIREGHTFTGWFTSQTGGTRVLSGAYGNNFASNSTIFARWTPRVTRSVNDTPANFRENFDWFRDSRHIHEPVLFGRHNLIFDQIWAGNGTINFAIRWDSNVVISFEDRRLIQLLLHEEVNRWTRPLIGFEDWPFDEVQVTVVGWAVRNINVLQDLRPGERVWVNNVRRAPFGASNIPGNEGDLQPSLPDNMSRFVNFTRVNDGTHNYPNGLHNRFDMYLWGTSNASGNTGMGGGAGGDWGTRMGCTQTRTAARANPPGAMVLSHEIGHGFGKYDFYGIIGIDRPFPTADGTLFNSGTATTDGLRSVMVVGGGTSVPSVYDQWKIRYYWNWVRQDAPATRFRTSLQPLGTELASTHGLQAQAVEPMEISETMEIYTHNTEMVSPEKNIEAAEFAAEFEETYDIEVFSTATGGTITINGGRVTAIAGSNNRPAIGGTATANGHWNFSTNTNNSETGATHSTGAFTNQSSFSFVRLVRSFTIIAASNPPSGGIVSGGGNITVGSTASLSATPNDGYIFDGWFEGETQVSASAAFGFTVTGNRSLTARFSSATEETVIYNMQTTNRVHEGGFDSFAGMAGLSAANRTAFAPLDRTGNGEQHANGPTVFTVTTSPARTISVTGRGGVAHAVRLMIGGTEGLGGSGAVALPTSPGNSYRLEYTGIFPAGGTPRFRFEGSVANPVLVQHVPGGVQTLNEGSPEHVIVDGSPVAAGVTFTHSVTLTHEQIAALGSRNVSLSATSGTIDINYRNIRIIRIPPGAIQSSEIALNPSGNHVFPSIVGNATPATHSVAVSNISTLPTGALTVALSGQNVDNFVLSRTSIPSIAEGAAPQSFTVAPRAGLALGVHRATVTVSGNDIREPHSFNVEVIVTAEPVFSIGLSPSGDHNFGRANVGYSPIAPHSISISNTGNAATGGLAVRLSGENASSFELSRSSVSSISVGDAQSFTVRPRNALTPGLHTATVTVETASTVQLEHHQTATITTSGTASWENHNLVNSANVPTRDGAPDSRPAAGNSWGTWGQTRNGGSAATSAFIRYAWEQPIRMSQTEILWYDDGGGTRIPTADTWAIQFSNDGVNWQNVTLTGGANYSTGRALNTFNSFEFEEIEARYLRVYIWGITPTGTGTGIVRWRVSHEQAGSIALVPQSFNVQFMVRSWSVSVEPADDYIFPTADAGYNVPPTHSVNVLNTGNQPTGTLRVALSGESAENFALSQTSIESISVGEMAELTVLPNVGLLAGIYEATVTVETAPDIITSARHTAEENATISTSGTASWENHARVRDTAPPANSRPGTGNGWGTWGQTSNGASPSASAFLRYRWEQPVLMNRAEIYWYDDNGGTRIPAASTWAIQFSNDGENWQNVTLTGGANYSTGRALDTFNSFEFEEIESRYLRIYIWGITANAAGTGVLRFHVFHDTLPPNIAPQSFNVSFTVTGIAHVPVTNIDKTSPVTGTAGTPITLEGTALPTNATNRTIVWSLGTESTAPGAAVNAAGQATATGAGTVNVVATVADGSADSEDFTQNFTITFAAQPCPDCDRYPCECPGLCPVCDKYPCECPGLCPVCDKYPCECPGLCPVCDKYPCECPGLCPVCDKYPCECPGLCPVCD
ncbi:MAG: InlB B-repeat-containing protein, partial [Defluviitaleaceae bacterium]|nr:InlB B-repeat-containing protein [Defluviitaleaceae bacterium]